MRATVPQTDDATLTSLEAALIEAPENVALIEVVVKALLDRAEPERALGHCKGDGASVKMLRARALLPLDRRGEAHIQYRAAVDENPTLEDRDLASLVSGPPPFYSRAHVSAHLRTRSARRPRGLRR